MNRAAIASCCLLAAAVQARVIAVSPTPAADAIRYVAVAREVAAQGWLAALRASDEHPLYPLCVAAVAQATEQIVAPRRAWVDAAQLVSVICAIGVVPLSWLAFRRIVDERAALGAALVLALWPMLARSGADALSDSLQWLTVAAAWACLARDARWLPALAGLVLGLGSLARAEAYVVLLAFTSAELAFPPLLHRDGLGRLTRAAALGGGFAVAPLLLLALSQPTGLRDAAARLLGRPRTDQAGVAQPAPEQVAALSVPIKERAVTSRFAGLRPAARAFVRELGNAGNWIWAPLLLGLAAGRRASNAERPARRRAILTSALYAVLVLIAASKLGYLTERHVVLALYFLLPWAGLGLVAAWETITAALTRWTQADIARARRGAAALAGAALALALVKAIQPVHLSRGHHREAAEWLAASPAEGAVFDTRGWTELYSGRATYRVDRSAEALRDPQLAYLVIEARELRPENRRSEALRAVLAAGGELVQSCASSDRPATAVLIYRWHPERLAARPRGAVTETPRPQRDA